MPFDPDQPAFQAPNSSEVMRAQLNALKALIDSIPAGPPGPQGAQGNPGNDGPAGPPFAQAVVDGVATLEPGSVAMVTVSFDGTTVHFSFGLPRGSDGLPGAPGLPGEVSAQQLADGLLTCSANTNGVETLNITASDPPTQVEVQALINKVNELILALRR